MTEALNLKEDGNSLFRRGKFQDALDKYQQAIKLDPDNHIYHSNASACYFGLKKWDESVKEADLCIKKNPKWGKGYWRKGKALLELKKPADAVTVLNKGLEHEPDNKELFELFHEAERAVKLSEPKPTPTQNPQPTAPQPSAAPKDMSKMTPAEALKEEGNTHYKSGAYPAAVEKYQAALDHPSAQSDQGLIISCLNNQAACHQQLQQYQQVVDLCTRVIELDSENLKAYTRRGLARETLEKHKLALEDFMFVIQRDPNATQAQQGANRVRQYIQKYY